MHFQSRLIYLHVNPREPRPTVSSSPSGAAVSPRTLDHHLKPWGGSSFSLTSSLHPRCGHGPYSGPINPANRLLLGSWASYLVSLCLPLLICKTDSTFNLRNSLLSTYNIPGTGDMAVDKAKFPVLIEFHYGGDNSAWVEQEGGGFI